MDHGVKMIPQGLNFAKRQVPLRTFPKFLSMDSD